MMDATGRNVVQNFNNSGFDFDADKIEFDAAKVQTLDDIDVAFDGEKLTVKVGRALTEFATADSDGYTTLELIDKTGKEYIRCGLLCNQC